MRDSGLEEKGAMFSSRVLLHFRNAQSEPAVYSIAGATALDGRRRDEP
jgi:hypothetical protein